TKLVAAIGADVPARRRVVPGGGYDARRETDVATEIVLVGDVTQIAEDLGLRGVSFGPLPLGLELGIEAVRVVDALDVAASTRVADPVPRAAHVAGALDHGRREPEAAQPVEHVEPGEAATHHDDVEVHIAGPARPDVPCGHPPPLSHGMSPEVDGGCLSRRVWSKYALRWSATGRAGYTPRPCRSSSESSRAPPSARDRRTGRSRNASVAPSR